jgi:2-keto-4-pentenoate hydratase/2-oxohepta-3-ene-1,7-dioic acid hydratase in catechol pathway
MTFALATIVASSKQVVAIETEGRYYPLPEATHVAGEREAPNDLVAVFANWLQWRPVIERVAAQCFPPRGIAAAEVKVLTPLQYPGKVLCAGANYYDHLKEMGMQDLRKEAQRLFFFFKPPRNAVVGPGATVIYPADTQKFDWEIELAVVIGKSARRVPEEHALEHIAGYTVGIDLSARDLNSAPETFYKLDWVAGKGQDTCCPLGPRIVPAQFIGNPQDLGLTLSVNGVLKQDARTSGMVFSIAEQIAILSRIMTLDPGDVLLTGTPAGVGMPRREFLKPGDRIDAAIENVGTLSVEITAPQP